MPNVTAIPRGQSNGQVLREFVDSVGTSSVTYTYPTTQEWLTVRNSGSKAITVTVSGTNQTVQPGQRWETNAIFSSFDVVSSSGVQSFEATADESGSVFDTPEGRYLPLVGTADVNVKYFGAKGDGVADDRNAFQRAVDYAYSKGGGIVRMPPGRFKLLSSIIWKSKVSLIGAGPGLSVLVPVGQGFSAIQQITDYSESNPLTDCTFADFEIDGTSFTDAVYAVGSKGIFILYMRRCAFRNLYIHDTPATGLGADFLDQTIIHNVLAVNCGRLWTTGGLGGAGIGIGTGIWSVETLTISDCQAIGCGNHGIFVEKQGNATYAAKHIRIVNCVAINGRNNGISDKGVGNLHVIGCTMSGNAASGMNIAGNVESTEGLVQNCTISDNTLDGVLIGQLTNARYKFSNNRIARNLGQGIKINTASAIVPNLTITDNEIHENGLPGINFVANASGNILNLDLSRNNVWNNGKSGTVGAQQAILIQANLTGFKIVGNRCFDSQTTKTQSRGIELKSVYAINTGVIEQNDVRGNVAAVGFQLTGTIGADVTNQNNPGST